MGKTTKRKLVFDRFIGDLDNTNNKAVRDPVQYTEVNTLFKRLIQAIQTGDFSTLQQILSEDFITPSNIPLDTTQGRGNAHSFSLTYETYYAENVLEVLFFQHNYLFYGLLHELNKNPNQYVDLTFMTQLKKTTIPSDIFSPWTQEEIGKIIEGINQLTAYEGHSGEKETLRTHHAQELAEQLFELVNNQMPPSKSTPECAIAWAQYKYQFVRILHSKDEHFEHHLGWKRVVANLVSLIFSAAIANIIHWAVTGEFFFCNQTTTQSLVTGIAKGCDSAKYLRYIRNHLFFVSETLSERLEKRSLLSSLDYDTDSFTLEDESAGLCFLAQ